MIKDETLMPTGHGPVAALHQNAPDHMTLPWLKLRESSFELVKFELSSELKNEASNIRTS